MEQAYDQSKNIKKKINSISLFFISADVYKAELHFPNPYKSSRKLTHDQYLLLPSREFVDADNPGYGDPGHDQHLCPIPVLLLFLLPKHKAEQHLLYYLPEILLHMILYMTKLSVNINKLATLRNARGGNNPDIIKAAIDIQRFGADGITVHPRPDERHIRYADVKALREVVKSELNIEGNCREQKFIDLVLATIPEQVTLVPDAGNQLTSDHGWDTVKHKDYLRGNYSCI